MSTVKKSVLFVDDEPNVLSSLKRILKHRRKDWDMYFASSGEEALEHIRSVKFDVVVSDFRMPGLNGKDVLSRVRLEAPGTLRLILSGHANDEQVLRRIGPVHQFLSKPCKPELLEETILQGLETQSKLNDLHVKLFSPELAVLPSAPSIHMELMKMAKEDVDPAEYSNLLSNEPGLLERTIGAINQAYLSPDESVSSIPDAIERMGVETVRCATIYLSAVDQFSSLEENPIYHELIMNSLKIGYEAGQIMADYTMDAELIEQAMLAGFLSDIGIHALWWSRHYSWTSILELSRYTRSSLYRLEYDTFGTTHCEIGAYVLEQWGFPENILDAVTYHHHPTDCSNSSISPLTAVHLALDKFKGSQILNQEKEQSYIEQIGVKV